MNREQGTGNRERPTQTVGFVWVNGQVVERAAAQVSAFDRSFLYGDGLFETIRAYSGVPFLLDRHLERMEGSARELGIVMPDKTELAAAVAELIRRNELSDAYVRITLSRGEHAGALAPDKALRPTVVVEAHELQPYPAVPYKSGARVIISSLRHESGSWVRRHKTTSYMTGILARRDAKMRGADEAILLDAAGHVAEGATSNVFCVRAGRLVTPPLVLNILPGITRSVVLGLAAEAGVDASEALFGLAELNAADEVFLTNSLMEVLPVRTVDGCEIGAAPGRVTRDLMKAYREQVIETCNKKLSQEAERRGGRQECLPAPGS